MRDPFLPGYSYKAYLSFFACFLALLVITLGVYTRLTDAGLGCPDWPGCYGHWLVPRIDSTYHNLIDVKKAWTEMFHRYLAGILSLSIFILGFFSFKYRHFKSPGSLPYLLMILIIFQGLLGMWTVTLKLLPIVVMAHLLGGLTTLSLLWWLTLKTISTPLKIFPLKDARVIQCWALIGLMSLIIQILLGGWTSANYASLACTDFPHCQSHLNLTLNLKEAFKLSAGVQGYGKPLSSDALMTIHMLHRIGALITGIIISGLCLKILLFKNKDLLFIVALITLILLILQIILGITNVLALLPLSVAVAHTFIAALLLLSMITLNYYVFSNSTNEQ